MWTRRATLLAGLQAGAAVCLAPMLSLGGQASLASRLKGRLVVVEPALPESLAFAAKLEMAGARPVVLPHDPSEVLLALDEGWKTGAVKRVSGVTRPVAFRLVEAIAGHNGRYPTRQCFTGYPCNGLQLHRWHIT